LATRNLEVVRECTRNTPGFCSPPRLEAAPARLDQVLLKGVELVSPLLHGKQVRLVFDPLPEVTIVMNEVLILRLVGNLLANAIKASPAGAIVQLELDPMPRGESGGEWVRLQIIDHGQGIKHEDLERLLDPPFARSQPDEKTGEPGLGMAICRTIVQLHGGRWDVLSEEQKGTTVSVDLPAAAGVSRL
ncbi:MAG: ATP-binding protein, partial [Candidatus Omnitrophica bacterium]|nr:ATP-binding protein [Candidatus Omnitrophota bacterium]